MPRKCCVQEGPIATSMRLKLQASQGGGHWWYSADMACQCRICRPCARHRLPTQPGVRWLLTPAPSRPAPPRHEQLPCLVPAGDAAAHQPGHQERLQQACRAHRQPNGGPRRRDALHVSWRRRAPVASCLGANGHTDTSPCAVAHLCRDGLCGYAWRCGWHSYLHRIQNPLCTLKRTPITRQLQQLLFVFHCMVSLVAWPVFRRRVSIVSSAFEGKNPVQRHRWVQHAEPLGVEGSATQCPQQRTDIVRTCFVATAHELPAGCSNAAKQRVACAAGPRTCCRPGWRPSIPANISRHLVQPLSNASCNPAGWCTSCWQRRLMRGCTRWRSKLRPPQRRGSKAALFAEGCPCCRLQPPMVVRPLVRAWLRCGACAHSRTWHGTTAAAAPAHPGQQDGPRAARQRHRGGYSSTVRGVIVWPLLL